MSSKYFADGGKIDGSPSKHNGDVIAKTEIPSSCANHKDGTESPYQFSVKDERYDLKLTLQERPGDKSF